MQQNGEELETSNTGSVASHGSEMQNSCVVVGPS